MPIQRVFSKSFLPWCVFLSVFVMFSTPSHAALNQAEVEISVLPETTVYGDEFQLGEIAEIVGNNAHLTRQLSSMRIGQSPRPGQSKQLYRNQLQVALNTLIGKKKYELNLPKSITITRASLVVDQKYIEQMINNSLKRGDQSVKNVTMLTKLQPIVLPVGEFKGEAALLKTLGKSGVSTWKITLRKEDKVLRQIYVRTTKAHAQADAGGVFRSDTFAQKQNVSGNYPVNAGQKVLLRYTVGSLELSTMATALQKGQQGDIIRVRNEGSRRVLEARVVQEREVEVFF